MKKQSIFWEKQLPLILLGLLFVCMLIFIGIQTRSMSYGLTTDQAMHESYGHTTFEWYKTLGRDQSFLNYPPETYEPQHGALFDVIVYIAQRLFQHEWYTEALIIGLTGLLGIFGIALCGLELGGWWLALVAALNLCLFPRYFGAILNNPKDIPFTTATIFVLWSVLRLLKQWDDEKASLRNSLLVALFLAIAISIRITAVLWYAILGIMLAGWWLFHLIPFPKGESFKQVCKRQIIAILIIGPGSFLLTMLFWPYIFISPFKHFYDALIVNASYPWDGAVLFEGQMQLATALPKTYALVWLVIGSPPALLLLAGIEILLNLYWLGRKWVIDARQLMVVLAALLPLALLVCSHSVLYNGLRQFLFILPPLMLLAASTLIRLFRALVHHRQVVIAGVLVFLTIANFGWIISDMWQLHPYEYAYFSPLIGGIHGANGKYELDYWNTCQRASSQWLGEHYQEYVTSDHPTVLEQNIGFQYMPFLPKNFQAVHASPNFLIDIAPLKTTIPDYSLIHTESVEGIPLCKVYVHTSIP